MDRGADVECNYNIALNKNTNFECATEEVISI